LRPGPVFSPRASICLFWNWSGRQPAGGAFATSDDIVGEAVDKGVRTREAVRLAAVFTRRLERDLNVIILIIIELNPK
jgi:hypothetical protein